MSRLRLVENFLQWPSTQWRTHVCRARRAWIIGILRLRRSSASLHSGSAQDDKRNIGPATLK